MLRRVAITGIGILSSLGRGKAEHLDAVLGARSGVTAISRFDGEGFRCRIAGEVPTAALTDMSREVDRVTAYALIAASEAVGQAGLAIPSERIAAAIGTALGGSETLEASYERMFGKRETRFHPMTIPKVMYNAPTSAISARFGARGPAFAPVSACASSAHAIGQAAHWIRFGLADAAIAGGADAPITPGIVRAWEALRVLAPSEPSPAAACRPFNSDRAGLVLGEGAAVFVLEEMGAARARGAAILGEIAGFGMTADGGHLTDPSAEGAARAMRIAIEDGRLDPGAIGYVNAHGTATRANDIAESQAIRSVFGASASRLPVSSTKSMHAHAMGASGAIETALSLVALNAGWLPPTLNLDDPDPACDMRHVPIRPEAAEAEAFLSNSFAFGGLNAVLAVRTIRGIA